MEETKASDQRCVAEEDSRNFHSYFICVEMQLAVTMQDSWPEPQMADVCLSGWLASHDL